MLRNSNVSISNPKLRFTRERGMCQAQRVVGGLARHVSGAMFKDGLQRPSSTKRMECPHVLDSAGCISGFHVIRSKTRHGVSQQDPPATRLVGGRFGGVGSREAPSVDHKEDEVCRLAHVHHRGQVVAALEERQPPVLRVDEAPLVRQPPRYRSRARGAGVGPGVVRSLKH